jgi:hypothetical protein
MIKPLLCLGILSTGISTLNLAQAEGGRCFPLGYSGGGEVTQVDCSAVVTTLSASKQFPDILAGAHPKTLGLCFASNGAIPITIGDQTVNISTVSAWTNQFLPLPLGGDTLAGVITAWTVTDFYSKKMLGHIFTRDTLDIVHSTEQDIVIGGSNKYDGAKGALRLDSESIIVNGVATGAQINAISGEICLPD